MKAYAYIKIKENKHPQGTTTGDIIYVYPMVEDQGKLTLNNFIPVVMDLKIPCGEKFNDLSYDCSRCKDNDFETCDVIKYQRAKWSPGDIDNPPKVEKARRYSIDRTDFISGESEVVITKDEKTEIEKETIITNAVNNEQLESIIIEKTLLEIIK